MKKTCIKASAVTLSIFWYTQIAMAKAVMLEARTETICPIHIIEKPAMPVGRCCWVIVSLLANRELSQFYQHNHPVGALQHRKGVKFCATLVFCLRIFEQDN